MKILSLILAATFTFGSTSDPFSQLTDLDGKTFSQKAGSKKRLVYFWATWCSDCREKLANGLKKISKDVDLITVNMDNEVDRVKHVVSRDHIDLPVLRDNQKYFSSQLNIMAVPHWAIYENKDGNWKLTKSQTGGDLATIEQSIKK